MNSTLGNNSIDDPLIECDSEEEAQLFVTAIYAHLVLEHPLTSRVSDLVNTLGIDSGFRGRVCKAISAFSSEGVLTKAGREKLERYLKL